MHIYEKLIFFILLIYHIRTNVTNKEYVCHVKMQDRFLLL